MKKILKLLTLSTFTLSSCGWKNLTPPDKITDYSIPETTSSSNLNSIERDFVSELARVNSGSTRQKYKDAFEKIKTWNGKKVAQLDWFNDLNATVTNDYLGLRHVTLSYTLTKIRNSTLSDIEQDTYNHYATSKLLSTEYAEAVADLTFSVKRIFYNDRVILGTFVSGIDYFSHSFFQNETIGPSNSLEVYNEFFNTLAFFLKAGITIANSRPSANKIIVNSAMTIGVLMLESKFFIAQNFTVNTSVSYLQTLVRNQLWVNFFNILNNLKYSGKLFQTVINGNKIEYASDKNGQVFDFAASMIELLYDKYAEYNLQKTQKVLPALKRLFPNVLIDEFKLDIYLNNSASSFNQTLNIDFMGTTDVEVITKVSDLMKSILSPEISNPKYIYAFEDFDIDFYFQTLRDFFAKSIDISDGVIEFNDLINDLVMGTESVKMFKNLINLIELKVKYHGFKNEEFVNTRYDIFKTISKTLNEELN